MYYDLGTEMKPMLAVDLKPGTRLYDQITADPMYVMEPKLDGVRAILTIGRDGVEDEISGLYTRTGNDLFAKVPHLAKSILEHNWRPGHYDMEIGLPVELTPYPRINFHSTMRVIGSSPMEAVRKARENQWFVECFVFDWIPLDYNGNDTLNDRLNALAFMDLPTGFHKVEHEPFSEEVFNDLVLWGGEGIMLKNLRSPYQWGKRPQRTWYKIKKFETLDVYVVNMELGEGKYANMVGALWFAETPYAKQSEYIGKCSGMTDNEREEWTNLFIQYGTIRFQEKIPPLNRIIEVKHYGKLVNGLRHPQYLKWKKPE
jgi:ATP-dependent DNA ligase